MAHALLPRRLLKPSDDIAEKDQGAVPHTITGTKLQVPVTRILQGTEIEQVADRAEPQP